MKKNKILFASCILIASFLTNCSNSNEKTCKYASVPNSLNLKITKSGAIVSDLILSETKLSYYEKNNKKYVSDFSINNIESNFKNKGLISTRNIGVISANNNIKTFYLEYPNGWKTDLLYVDYIPNTPETNCMYVLKPIKVNNVLAIEDNSFIFKPVYEINIP